MHPNVHSNIIYNCQDMEATLASINRRMDKEVRYIYIYIYTHRHTYTHNGIVLNHNKERNVAICSNMDGLRGQIGRASCRERV